MGSVPIFLVLGFFALGAQAQDYPTRTIRLIVPLTAGAGADIAARIIAQRMNEHWKAAGDRREPARGGRADRYRGGGEGRGRRPYAARAVVFAFGEPCDLQEPALRSAEGSRRRRDPRQDAVRDGERGQRTVQDAQGADRSRAREAGHDRLLIGRPGHLDASRRRISDRPCRRAHDPRAVQGLARGIAGCARRALGVLHGAGQRRRWDR